ncbi:nucleoid-associated protein [Franzmannia pantelleriensis]|uniref:Nucleoid-associated protein n=1 Tax=Franzmannia pantelleriensis TaxID=48727 RepID=A0A1G9M587_9GAMM|nr:nucleoid-associated protein [Halomonas pantelleriensis]SDL69430.1 nucleoid-associated protein [Halomonas pantelleriensis]
MPVLQSIVHRLEPSSDNDRLVVKAAATAHPDSAVMSELVAAISDAYNPKPKGWGQFAEGEGASPLAGWLAAYLDGERDFADITQAIAERLAGLLEDRLSVGGYLIFDHSRRGEAESLSLALVQQRQGIGIDDNHQAVPAAQLNLGQLTLAARINLSQWRSESPGTQYVSFLKDRGGKKLAESMLELLGVAESIDAPSETRTLLKAFSDYVEQSDFDEDTSREKTDTLVDYASEQLNRGEPITLDELSALVDEQQPKAFYEHIRHADYGLAPEIPPDKRTLNQFRRFTGRAAGVSISFDSHLLGSSVEYDETRERLIIKTLPSQLREQLKQRQKGT